MLIAAYALQVRHAFIYIRGEFDLPYRRLAAAVEEAYAAGLLGERIVGTDFACDIVVYRGAGSYVCGEASGLLTSLEGKRGYPRNRPPRLTVRGLYQRPTVVNNVETLANITGIVARRRRGLPQGRHGEEPGHAADLDLRATSASPASTRSSTATRSRSSSARTAAACSAAAKLKCVIPGGISTKVLTAAEIEPLTLDHASVAARRLGARLGRHDRHRRRAPAWCGCCRCWCASTTTSRAASARRAAKAWAGCTGSSTASSPARASPRTSTG